MISLRQERARIREQLLHIEATKRLHAKFSTIEGYMYCIADERRYKRRLAEINYELEEIE